MTPHPADWPLPGFYTSVTRDGVDADSLFPEQPITPSELGAEA